MRRAVLLLTVLALACTPMAAPAQVDPFGPLPPPAPTPTPVPEPVDDPGGGDVGRTTLVLVGLGVLASFFLLGWLITRDARRSLTEGDRAALEREERGRSPEASPAARRAARRKARQKAKAQRAARRRNR